VQPRLVAIAGHRVGQARTFTANGVVDNTAGSKRGALRAFGIRHSLPFVERADEEFDEKYASLLAAASEASELLRRYGEDRWASWLDMDAERIRRGDRYGVDHLLTAFGGMGSLNDLVIHPLNGHNIAEQDLDPVNQRLSALVGTVAHHARGLKHELGRG
jgi:hypothetical protein